VYAALRKIDVYRELIDADCFFAHTG